MITRRTFVETVFLAYGYYMMSAEGDTRTGNRCIQMSRVFAVQLRCSENEWIHVVHEVYGDGDAETCHLKSTDACSELLASSQQGLIVNCNGKQSCLETITVQRVDKCGITAVAAEVKFNCVKDSINMCSPVRKTVNGSVYLHSPGFPDSVGVNSSCVVWITGQNLQVTLVEARMRSGMLNISGDGRQLWTNMNANEYNRVLEGLTAEIVIVYDNHDQDGSNVWIHVVAIDSGQMNIVISREIEAVSTTPTSTQQLSRSHSTSSSRTSDTATTETTSRALSTAIAAFTTATSTRGHTTHSKTNAATQWSPKSTTIVSTTASLTDTNNSELEDVVIALAVVCGILVVIIVVLVIYFMVVKPFRKKKNTSSNTVASDGHGESNVYDGIQRGTSEAGDEHNYGHITSGGPLYVNSVSGSDPYVNT